MIEKYENHYLELKVYQPIIGFKRYFQLNVLFSFNFRL